MHRWVSTFVRRSTASNRRSGGNDAWGDPRCNPGRPTSSTKYATGVLAPRNTVSPPAADFFGSEPFASFFSSSCFSFFSSFTSVGSSPWCFCWIMVIFSPLDVTLNTGYSRMPKSPVNDGPSSSSSSPTSSPLTRKVRVPSSQLSFTVSSPPSLAQWRVLGSVSLSGSTRKKQVRSMQITQALPCSPKGTSLFTSARATPILGSPSEC
mmetsp:Transcript_39925/g.77620  ORF Transcript_39925/g.77620 Transcript_39925/m.77620 type:complete len:208 (-) Transcript_39925:2213-2836(-)